MGGDTNSIALFLLLSIILGWLVIWKKDQLPASMRRGVALVVISLLTMAFTLMVISLFQTPISE